MKGVFEEQNEKLNFKLYSATSENGLIFNVPVNDCIVLENSDSSLVFDYGVRRFAFSFNNYVPKIRKVSLKIKLFKFVPFYSSTGEIGLSFQKELSGMFNKVVNESLKEDDKERRRQIKP